jgi:hypothetical protein
MVLVGAARVHRHHSRPEGADVNAYIVETDNALVAVDSTLTVTDSRATDGRTHINAGVVDPRPRQTRLAGLLGRGAAVNATC